MTGWKTSSEQRMWNVEDMMQKRVGAMVLILLVSLAAVTFPGLSRKIRFLRIPHIVFFIGKHFGTGVILATAFCHLLQDAFTSLLDPEVKASADLSRWTGLIILASLLSIFLVEYISTSYVDRLNADPSAPPTPSPSPSPSRAVSPPPPSITVVINSEVSDRPSERTPLIRSTSPKSPSPCRREGIPIPRQRSHSLHEASSPYLPLIHSNNPRYVNILGDRDHHRCCCTHDEFCGSKRKERKHGERERHVHHHKHPAVNGEASGGPPSKPSLVGIFVPAEFASHHGAGERGRSTERGAHSHNHNHSHGHAHGHGGHQHGLGFLSDEEDTNHSPAPVVGRRRQVVGILVLQLGIMIHSLVIGLTLSITPDSDFTPLLTAIFFHQLFEGLSLGIRIASLPPPTNRTSHSILSPTLSGLFAITTPAGILVGLLSFGGGEGVQLRLTQGVMSAISAGMLIYASCVEMLAGDFVMDPHMHMGVGGLRRQLVALVSLLCGVVGMTLVD